jgi:hypothetical protein
MQALIIAVALASACFFSAMLARFRFWRGGFLVMSVIDLLCVAGYGKLSQTRRQPELSAQDVFSVCVRQFGLRL